jgi:uncharacterized membrane protein YgcG
VVTATRRAAVRALLLLAALGAVMALAAPAGATDKSLAFPRLDTVATLLPTGDLQVVEQVTYDFQGGPFTIGVREFDPAWRSRIQDFTASVDGTALQVDPPSATPTGEWEWHVPAPTSDTEVTYTLSYTVPGAATVGSDVAELYWDFTGENHPYIGAVHVEVHLPGSSPNATPDTPPSDASVVRAWGHGPRNGTVALGQSVVTADVDGVPQGQFVELRILVPTTDMTVATTGGPRLADVLAEEGEFIDRFGDRPAEPDPWYTPIGTIGSPVAAGAGLLALGALWRKWGREPKPREVLGEYWREPLDDPPAIVVATMGKGSLDRPKAIAGTLMDLAQRGYIRISADERGKEHTFHWMGKQYGPDVQPFEKELLDLVFRGQTVMSEDDLTRWARQHRTEASKEMTAWAAEVTRLYKTRHYSTGPKGKPMAALVLIGLAVAGAGALAFALSGPIGWVAIGAAALVFIVGTIVLGNRTQAGAEAHARAKGLAKYLKDFSQLDEAPVGHLILWERFLVYSVALGVSGDLVRNIAFKVPEVANNPGFAVWYVGPGRGLDRFDSVGRMGDVGSSIASSFSPPSKSGSGGGFSGGGGGGGGGGGFGAR